jgi:hypothetical protein
LLPTRAPMTVFFSRELGREEPLHICVNLHIYVEYLYS